MIKIVKLSHDLLAKHSSPEVALDMTAGNGQDTLFLSKISKKVYAFDIQEEAITKTLKLLEENQVFNVEVIRESHDLFDIFVSEQIDLAIYNLGYLPSGNKDIKTEARIVINSLRKLMNQLKSGAIVVIVIYLHNLEESKAIDEFVSNLSADYDAMKHVVMNRSSSPYIIEIKKI